MRTRVISFEKMVAIFVLFGALLVARNGGIEAQAPRIRSVQTFTNYDLDSTTLVYNDSGGAGANDGWIVVATETNRSVQVEIDQLNVTGGIDFLVEARLQGSGGGNAQIWPSPEGTFRNETAVGSFIAAIPDDVYEVRIGMKIGTADDGDDLTVNAEDITVTVETYAGDPR